ncbi:hypothetical protein KTS45_13450 [Halomicroarcula limicola]|uniref:Uncharacterized protein n=1 Tax=Haloarcula limicola TaxID=1429915 RepID=A0A8J7Y612_9EURY|nr:hypothetical protein [Halomicroarcula limicola]MBV0925205.1 hypothetical protein [Halomicroarcula limicola]
MTGSTRFAEQLGGSVGIGPLKHVLSAVYNGVADPSAVPAKVERWVGKRHPLLFRKYLLQKNRSVYGYCEPPDPLQLINVDPDSVSQALAVEHGCYYWQHHKCGTILDGPWDQDTTPVDELLKVRALSNHFKHDVEWKETALYAEIIESHTHEEALSQLEIYDKLYTDLQDGYKTSFELPETDFMEEICVCIGRHGEILFSHSGTHRLALVRALELDEVPVRVMVRHAKWQEIRESLSHRLNDANKEVADFEEYLDHPDLHKFRSEEKYVTESYRG